MRTTDQDTWSAEAFDVRPTADVSAAISRLVTTGDTAEVERLADDLAVRASHDAWPSETRIALVDALVRCLTADSIREDPDAEDAVCSALELIGVMNRLDHLVFVFLPESELGANELITIRRYRGWLPSRYAAPTSTR